MKLNDVVTTKRNMPYGSGYAGTVLEVQNELVRVSFEFWMHKNDLTIVLEAPLPT
jgi:hypothetical protein